ncbi:intermembrane transport protein PqiB [Aliiglaciecola sp. CAU 1673]|uniref:intermembrane transport protein PqiB n=1 Tax=Aliiglaciecola sp. CAU 1673 TaxID=3032595 RepID=UPI0023DAD7E5|nr:intermembrane transport protein PqiB [Aliiglaciecola sp. CAU 1673]MDF2178965.1 intermembrane transport protein PqiB [Aliiglaciecola sp. CAU 1673]
MTTDNTPSPSEETLSEETRSEGTQPEAAPSDTPRAKGRVTTEARIETASSWSKVWLIPLVALGVGLWMIYLELSQQGPLVTIEFHSAEGLEAGKTKLKARNVDIGLVKTITLAPGSEGVLVKARMTAEAAPLLTEDAAIWVVTPKISLSGVTGLSTLFSGAYIEVSPGKSNHTATKFRGLDEPPLTPMGAPGLHLTLGSNDEFAFSEGDPIIYKGLTVGKFENVYFNYQERQVYYNAFIEAPYHQLITENTRFWNASGIKVELGTEGLSMQTGNLQTLLTNGVTFGVPEGLPLGKQITDRVFFHIHHDQEAALAMDYDKEQSFMLMMSESVRGLVAGAPVEYRGLVVGRVIAINPKTDKPQELMNAEYRIPVLISIKPGLVGLTDDEQGLKKLGQQIDSWIHLGLKARLETGNLLTGRQFVDLQHYPELAVDELTQYQGLRVIPAISGEISQLAQKVDALLDKLHAFPLEALASDTRDMLQTADTTLLGIQKTLSGVDSLLANVSNEGLISQINQTLVSIEELSRSFKGGSSSHEELRRAIRQFEETMGQLQPLLQQLNSQPNSLIFSEGEAGEPQPKAALRKGGRNE